MSKSKAETQMAGIEHELPPSDGDEVESQSAGGASPSEAAGLDAELQKLKAERDDLRDRLGRAQAEFDNARKRATKEQQDFRDYAAIDAIKPLLPVLDSFE